MKFNGRLAIHLRSAGLIVSLVFLAFTACVLGDHHLHHRHARLHHRSLDTNTTSDDPAALVKNALAALAKVNKDRTSNPNFNNLAFDKAQRAKKNTKSTATPLEYNKTVESSHLRHRDTTTATPSGNRAYSIPSELARAAAIVAETTPNKPTGNHSNVASQIRKKYGKGRRDTNTPRQALVHSNGLYDYISTGTSDEITIGNDTFQSKIQKRDTSKYWMTTVEQNGQSPFAPTGYNVWRDVRDYGAKGDGVTDDTAAINKAISDGGRCGVGCGSSTIYPATVWFPAGTYLISSPIIQYYNTEFLGDPLNVPTILAASSFVGLGVITSDVYVSDDEEWYINQNNILRSVRNFKIDIRLTDPSAYVCAIHWQVGQGTSLENIEFYMLYNSDVPSNTQQGIYMENGSGGFLADLTFVGGNFGAYFGNQQFTSSQLVFVNCNTALQVHWDWAWTMQDYVIESCTNGLTIVGGAGGPSSTGQGVGSLILADAIIANTPNGIVTSLHAENSTSLLLQNVGFFNVKTAVIDSAKNKILLAGGDEVLKSSWGFGKISDASGVGSFANGEDIPAILRPSVLLGNQSYVRANLFTRRRPQYENLAADQIVNVKNFGAKGDGSTDDTAILNYAFSYAANLSSVVYIPHGIYMIHDTLHIPVGSRIIGQAWSQIMATGDNFADAEDPRVAVMVGYSGDIGLVEIQDLLFTVSGPTAGAILVEWNVEQSVKGSAAMWDSHIRIGGAIGSKLQNKQCPKKTGKINKDCIAASLLLHLTASSTAYLENIWVWVADHDLDVSSQDQIDVYAARGILIESHVAWLYGTASEHSTLYQYQLSGAQNVLMGMIQTESPYYQPVPQAPSPFTPGMFPNDPQFNNCDGEDNCAVSWAVRIVDSSSIWILGSGIYSWFSDYSQACLDTDNCQQRAFEIEQSQDIWIYNLCTKSIMEMISPFKGTPTYAKDNVNGLLSSILAWLGGANQMAGQRELPGFSIYSSASLGSLDIPASCKTAMMDRFKCDDFLGTMMAAGYHGSLNNDTLTKSLCNTSCGQSLKEWYGTVQQNCAGYNISGAPPELFGGRMWTAYNETCSKDETSGKYCNAVIDDFTLVPNTAAMPDDELCSYCYTERLQMMQRTPYSAYDNYYQTVLEAINKRCGLNAPTTILEIPRNTPEKEDEFCASDNVYTTVKGDTCTSIGKAQSVSSAALYMGNQNLILDCDSLSAGLKFCLPLTCEKTYSIQPSDNCSDIEYAYSLNTRDVRKFNPWVSYDCDNLQVASKIYGTNICLSPQGGEHTGNGTWGGSLAPAGSDGFVYSSVAPPSNATLATGTTKNCGKWHESKNGDSCVGICGSYSITHAVLTMVNPSLRSATCSDSLQAGKTYCVGPTYSWNQTSESTSSAISASSSTGLP
ncbi:hypothetical protein N7455_004271 [Penicillium solitum]|uniref:uncharacterized protein n=1 Tax=Penicillium solitum TaxID=60172 RepID=UPI0032C3E776|nr:hypothetical protein N7455_004271 [Penicillium solitum]